MHFLTSSSCHLHFRLCRGKVSVPFSFCPHFFKPLLCRVGEMRASSQGTGETRFCAFLALTACLYVNRGSASIWPWVYFQYLSFCRGNLSWSSVTAALCLHVFTYKLLQIVRVGKKAQCICWFCIYGHTILTANFCWQILHLYSKWLYAMNIINMH